MTWSAGRGELRSAMAFLPHLVLFVFLLSHVDGFSISQNARHGVILVRPASPQIIKARPFVRRPYALAGRTPFHMSLGAVSKTAKKISTWSKSIPLPKAVDFGAAVLAVVAAAALGALVGGVVVQRRASRCASDLECDMQDARAQLEDARVELASSQRATALLAADKGAIEDRMMGTDILYSQACARLEVLDKNLVELREARDGVEKELGVQSSAFATQRTQLEASRDEWADAARASDAAAAAAEDVARASEAEARDTAEQLGATSQFEGNVMESMVDPSGFMGEDAEPLLS